MTTLTPQDIQSRQFHVRFRGFDVDEVDVFLEKVAEDFLTLIQENKQLREKMDSLSGEVENNREQDRSFKQAILSAQKIADEMKSKSRKEADDIVATARLEAKQLRDEANAEVTRLEKQLDELKDKRAKIRGELEQVLHAYLARLDEVFDEHPIQPSSESIEKEKEAPGGVTPLTGNDEMLSPVSEKVGSIDDLSDLYEKVDLPDEYSYHSSQEDNDDDDEAYEESKKKPEKHPRAMPDLDGDMMFRLEDPLDEDEPDIPITFGNRKDG